MRFLNTRLWVTVNGVLFTLLGLGNAASAETVSSSAWPDASAGELTIGTGLELVWGINLVLLGVTTILIAWLTQGSARARAGAVLILGTIAVQVVTILSLSPLGYSSDAQASGLAVLVPIVAGLVALVGLVACVTRWNEKSN
ncbi:MAG: hypothetical protein ABR66_06080 [Microbacteriaceae bacterium BACL25 MAG-120322-bin65]|jgi:hypothetical protein|nr:MAG: hypothetical protein ABR66_06080 [Microbacteriaceae bacterium BACL25 MAG-120322-bin65]HAA78853.1 hypothetical protein [Microbacteriaceae bacterium]